MFVQPQITAVSFWAQWKKKYLKATTVAYLERYKEILQRLRVLVQLAEQDVSA